MDQAHHPTAPYTPPPPSRAWLGAAAFHANTLRRTAAQVVLEVADTGGGIPAARLGQIFEPLHTTKPGGTGLGLYIVREIVQAYGGQVAVHSTVGQGTTFMLTLPRAPGADAAGGTCV